jgi:hypothetical protein
MDAGFLERLLSGSRTWSGPCVVITNASSDINVPGPDSVIAGGQRFYAPRVATGRLVADAVLLLKEDGVLLVVDQHRYKDGTGQTRLKQRLSIVGLQHVVGLEFDHVGALGILGIGDPPAVRDNEYRPGMLVG